MTTRKLLRRALVYAVLGVILLLRVYFTAHFVNYQEQGCTHFGTNAYEERGIGFIVPFSNRFKLCKIAVHERKRPLLKIETDFEQLRRPESETDVTSMKVTSWVPVVFFGEYMSTHCDNFIASMYESDEEFRSTLKEAVEDGTVSAGELAKATECCTLPLDDGTLGIRTVRDLYLQNLRRKQGTSGNPASQRP